MTIGGSLPDWFDKLTDPYSVLGLALTADDQRVLKRYRQVAKILHPDHRDQDDAETREIAGQLFSRLLNPAYQRLKQEKGRSEYKVILRIQVRRLYREGWQPVGAMANQLIRQPIHDVDMFYEHSIGELAELQYQSLAEFADITEQLHELNLAYFRLNLREKPVTEKRIGLVAAKEVNSNPLASLMLHPEVPTETYAQRHYRRAQDYMSKQNWSFAVQELRDAIKLEPTNSDYHALLGLAYFHQKLFGMARVHCRQALKLNPQNTLAAKYAAKLDVTPLISQNLPDKNDQSQKVQSDLLKQQKSRGLFDFFRSR